MRDTPGMLQGQLCQPVTCTTLASPAFPLSPQTGRKTSTPYHATDLDRPKSAGMPARNSGVTASARMTALSPKTTPSPMTEPVPLVLDRALVWLHSMIRMSSHRPISLFHLAEGSVYLCHSSQLGSLLIPRQDFCAKIPRELSP